MVFGEVARMDRPKMKIAEFDGESISGLCFHQNYREPLGKSDSSSFSLSTHPHSPTSGVLIHVVALHATPQRSSICTFDSRDMNLEVLTALNDAMVAANKSWVN